MSYADDWSDEDRGYVEEPDDEIPAITRTASAPTAQRMFDGTIVATWPCRATGCKNTVEVTAAAVDARARLSNLLVRKGEPPLREDECVFCDRCAKLYEQKRVEAVAKARAKIAEHVAELRDPHTPPHRVAVAEDYLIKRANDGQALVRLLAKERNTQPQTQVRGRRGTW